MATTFYIRTYRQIFSTYLINDTQSNNGMTYVNYTPNQTLITNSGVFNTMGTRKLYHVFTGELSDERFMEIPPSGDQFRLNVDYFRTENYLDTGNLSTIKNRLVNRFNNNKNDTTYAVWGQDKGEINMILFHYTFDNDPGKDYYTAVFYQGNDPSADETITI